VKIGPLKNVTAIRAGNYLHIVLPSGRSLYYPSPKVELERRRGAKMVDQVTFWGVNAKTRQWEKQRLYGGLITENIVQATARDVMANGKLTREGSGLRADPDRP
jgi:DNA polymerase